MQQYLFGDQRLPVRPAQEMWAQPGGGTVAVSEVACSSVLCRSRIPVIDYAVNPYVGCTHACAYCYAVFMGRFASHDGRWGSFLDAKVNAPEVLARELARAGPGNITFGTVTDPYQPLERRYGITRECLRAVRSSDFPVSILTKSHLVLRDIDVLQAITRVEVGLTITTLDDRVRARFEPHASPVSARLRTLRRTAEAGIRTWVFCGPLLPFLCDSAEQMSRLFSAIADAGATRVVVDGLNLKRSVWARVRPVVERHYPELTAEYQQLARNRRPYHDALLARARPLAARYGLECAN